MNSTTTDHSRTDEVYLHTHAGGRFQNEVALHASHQLDWDPAIVSYPVVRQTMLAFSKAFEPLWCEAGPFSLWKDLVRSRYKQGPMMLPSWMIHLPSSLAERITPPSGIISERYADGSLLMSVTDQTFDPENPKHVEAAHRLFAVVDTLQEKLPREQWRY